MRIIILLLLLPFFASAQNNAAKIIKSNANGIGAVRATFGNSIGIQFDSTGSIIRYNNTTPTNYSILLGNGSKFALSTGTAGQHLTGNGWKDTAVVSGATPTLQQVLTAGSTLTGTNSISWGSSSISIPASTGSFMINTSDGSGRSINVQADQATGAAILKASVTSDAISQISVYKDSAVLYPHKGQLNIDSLRTWSTIGDSAYKKPMTWDSRNGRWEVGPSFSTLQGNDTTRIVTGPTGYYQSAYSPRSTFMYEKADRFSFASDSTITPVTTDSTRHWYIPALTLVASGDWVGGNTATQKLVGYTTPNNSKISVYQVSAKVLVTAVGGGGTLTTTCTYTDEGNTSRTVTFYSMGSAVAGMTATGISSYPVLGEIQCYPNTEVSVTTTLTIGTATYDATSSIVFIRNYDQ